MLHKKRLVTITAICCLFQVFSNNNMESHIVIREHTTQEGNSFRVRCIETTEEMRAQILKSAKKGPKAIQKSLDCATWLSDEEARLLVAYQTVPAGHEEEYFYIIGPYKLIRLFAAQMWYFINYLERIDGADAIEHRWQPISLERDDVFSQNVLRIFEELMRPTCDSMRMLSEVIAEGIELGRLDYTLRDFFNYDDMELSEQDCFDAFVDRLTRRDRFILAAALCDAGEDILEIIIQNASNISDAARILFKHIQDGDSDFPRA